MCEYLYYDYNDYKRSHLMSLSTMNNNQNFFEKNLYLCAQRKSSYHSTRQSESEQNLF